MIYLSRYWQSIPINQRILLVKLFIKHVEDLEYDLNVSNSSRTTFDAMNYVNIHRKTFSASKNIIQKDIL